MINYHDRRFIPLSNSASGEVSPEVVFHYRQAGRIVTCRYSGGCIVSGQLIALVDAEGRLDMRYHQVNDRGEGMTGVCRSTPELLPDGHQWLRLSCGIMCWAGTLATRGGEVGRAVRAQSQTARRAFPRDSRGH
jgi:hypothetical protein